MWKSHHECRSDCFVSFCYFTHLYPMVIVGIMKLMGFWFLVPLQTSSNNKSWMQLVILTTIPYMLSKERWDVWPMLLLQQFWTSESVFLIGWTYGVFLALGLSIWLKHRGIEFAVVIFTIYIYFDILYCIYYDILCYIMFILYYIISYYIILY
jgi:hypothetical protein